MTTKEEAYRALSKAAERIGMNNYRSELAAHLKKGRSKNTYRYTPSEAHVTVIEAMPMVLDGTIGVEEAMAILHDYDVFKERMVAR